MTDTDSGSAESFRRLARHRPDLDALDLYGRVVERSPQPIGSLDRIQGAVDEIRQQIVSATARATTLYGWRTQALFEAVTASLGKVRLLKLEDFGDVFFAGEDLQPPDFHIVTEAGERIMVEVKNYHSASPRSPIRLRRSDVSALQRYSDLVGASDLKLAIY